MVDSRPKPHAILVCCPLQGHVIPTIHLTIKLAQKGFTITFINTQSTHDQITQKNSQDDIFSSYQGFRLDTRYMTVSDGLPVKFRPVIEPYQFLAALLHVFSAHVEEALLKIMESENDPPVNCLIADSFFRCVSRKISQEIWTFVHIFLDRASFGFYPLLSSSSLGVKHFGCTGKPP
ncbi:PREDICTED: UDP-glycosyltransferase 86A1-like [Nicotiana attenuata]|uniref:Udp-glycosyltransferase 86a1 n=1 Tax=Nicotiana attenuata TaxID=49451 RepID=A0A314KL11_NICAT|nr:PREDICTED: UDP-glycosyltransferase 86A1-like [Nicotiana attenuata]OIT29872.1 udp-glycosyltransferase 86a1 [Nicotiana attenuata]